METKHLDNCWEFCPILFGRELGTQHELNKCLLSHNFFCQCLSLVLIKVFPSTVNAWVVIPNYFPSKYFKMGFKFYAFINILTCFLNHCLTKFTSYQKKASWAVLLKQQINVLNRGELVLAMKYLSKCKWVKKHFIGPWNPRAASVLAKDRKASVGKRCLSSTFQHKLSGVTRGNMKIAIGNVCLN